MAFVNPFLLWGLFAASIPVLIYLLLRHRWKVVEWGAMQILLEILEEQKRRMQILEIILLILRTLMLAALALALARPLLTSQMGAAILGSAGDVLIVIDGSYSMQTGQGAGTRFDRAKEEALRILDETPSGFGVSLLVGSKHPDPILATYGKDHELIRETIKGLQPTDLAGDAKITIDEAKRLLDGSEQAIKRCHLISDFQLRDWASAEETFLNKVKELAQAGDLTLVPVGDGLTENTAVTELVLSSGAVRTGAPTVLTGTITNHGQMAVDNLAIDLLVDKAVMESQTVAIEPQSTHTVRFPYIAIDSGLHAATLRIRHDDLPADNQRHLPFEAVEAVEILAVVDDSVSLVEAKASDFIEICLNPYTERSDHPDAVYRLTTVNYSDLLAEDLAPYEMVILAQVDAPAELQTEMIENYVRGGGGAFVFLGQQTDIGLWNSLMHRDGDGLLPWPLRPSPVVEEGEAGYMGFRPKGEGHPVWSDLIGGSSDYFELVRFYEAFTFEPQGGDRAIVLGGVLPSTANEALPTFIDAELGRGHALIMGSSADLSMNNFAVRKVFVGFVNQAVGYLRSFRSGDTMVTVGDAARRYVDFQRSQATYHITSPSGEESGASIMTRDEEYILDLPPLTDAGFYKLVNQSDPTDRALIAANVEVDEGNIVNMGSAELVQAFADIELSVHGGEAVGSEQTTALAGAELATLLLILVLLCWLGENIVGHMITRL